MNWLAHQIKSLIFVTGANLGSVDVSTPQDWSIDEIKLEIFDSGKSRFWLFCADFGDCTSYCEKNIRYTGFYAAPCYVAALLIRLLKMAVRSTVWRLWFHRVFRTQLVLRHSSNWATSTHSKTFQRAWPTPPDHRLSEKIKEFPLETTRGQRLALNYYYKGDYTNALKYESIGLQVLSRAKTVLQ